MPGVGGKIVRSRFCTPFRQCFVALQEPFGGSVGLDADRVEVEGFVDKEVAEVTLDALDFAGIVS